MANTIRAAKNTFGGGLVMDLAPDTTPNEVLTSALNATLVTFNGNEMQLQNDMGNGRVETARLPEGYIPVGTCEFGDIIYIVSYNPLTNKSQIGCFPSPERNISSEEVGSMGQSLSSADFQVMNGNSPTGKLKTNSVKKIIYGNKLNPGDKFIIYDKNNNIHKQEHITDLSNTSHVYGAFPKWLRIHVVAIEDSGKINYLDSTLRWYDVNNLTGSYSYFVNEVKDTATGEVDIDAYRNKLSSGYSIFQSKVSGKLALLIELEKITGFSCTHTIYSKDGSEQDGYSTTKYLTYINFNWETDDPNVNPAAVILTNDEQSGKTTEWVGKTLQTGENAGADLAGAVIFWKKDLEDAKKVKLSDNPSYAYKSVKYYIGDNVSVTTETPYYDTGNYYETPIDNIDITTYDNFINRDCYDKKLKSIIGEIVRAEANYGDDVLSKLNIQKRDLDDYLKIPNEGHYYINAIGKDQEGNIQSKSSKTGMLFNINPVELPDYIVNNYFHYPIYKRFLEFEIPTKQKILVGTDENNENVFLETKPDISNMIYKYSVTPAMPYGLLEEYTVTNYIDFSKIGSGAIDFNTWKYFVGENALTLTLGLETYPEDNMGIAEIAIEFYDNQGCAAVYHIQNKQSYSGQFTEVIPLNGSTNKSNLNATNGAYTNAKGLSKVDGQQYIHCGAQLEEYQDGCLTLDGDNKPRKATASDTKFYMNDAGIIYQGMLYLAKIIVKYCPKDSLDNLDDTDTTRFKIFNRWLWTTTMYNGFYHQIRDFNDLSFTLSLDIGPKYEATSKYYWSKFKYASPESDVPENSDDLYKYISSNVQIVTMSDEVSQEVVDDGDNPGGGGGGGEQPLAAVWSNWKVDSNDGTLVLSMMCNQVATWDTSKLHVMSNDGLEYPLNGDPRGYSVAAGPMEVQLTIYNGTPEATFTIVSEPGFGYADNAYGDKNSPVRTLDVKYNVH